MTDREHITLPREVVVEALKAIMPSSDPRRELKSRVTEALRAALDAQEPVAWLRVIDEAMVTHHVGVADPADDYETAKRKMNNLLCHAQDIGAHFAAAEIGRNMK